MGFIKILKTAGAKIKLINKKIVCGEPVADIFAQSSKLKGLRCNKIISTTCIDELPILFVIASLTKGISKFKSISELAHKESSRAIEMKKILLQAGIKCKNIKDSFTIYGKNKISNKNKFIVVKTKGDHRICLSSAIFSLVTGIKTKINNFETVNTSFPGFTSLIKKSLGAKIEIKTV